MSAHVYSDMHMCMYMSTLIRPHTKCTAMRVATRMAALPITQ